MSAIPQLDASVSLSSLVTSSAGENCAYREMRLSTWTTSVAKRIFDLVVVLAFSPLICPLLLLVAAAVRLSSRGPAIFRQIRIGACGKSFTILKFRTMIDPGSDEADGIACTAAERITPVGAILRKIKLDELPQFFNVLRGDMSLVGPRPRIAEQQIGTFQCRPGITGAATLAFAREEELLAQMPADSVAQYYRECILPAKHRLDSAYMAQSSMSSDLRILLLTALGRWQAPRLASRKLREPSQIHAVHQRTDAEPVCGSEPA